MCYPFSTCSLETLIYVLPLHLPLLMLKVLYSKHLVAVCICVNRTPPSPVALAVVAELGLLTELTTVLLPLGGALDDEEEEDRPPSTESSSSKFLSAMTEAEKRRCMMFKSI